MKRITKKTRKKEKIIPAKNKQNNKKVNKKSLFKKKDKKEKVSSKQENKNYKNLIFDYDKENEENNNAKELNENKVNKNKVAKSGTCFLLSSLFPIIDSVIPVKNVTIHSATICTLFGIIASLRLAINAIRSKKNIAIYIVTKVSTFNVTCPNVAVKCPSLLML